MFKARMPFRFGVMTVRELERLTIRIEAEDEHGRRTQGTSADFMVPRWFSKDEAGTPERDVAALALSAQSAARRAAQMNPLGATVFAAWRDLEAATFEGLRTEPDAALVAGFGLALVERALMDAATRLAGVSFHEALLGNLFAFEPAALLPELAGWNFQSSLAARPSQQVRLRHTVGFLDVLAANDLGARVADGFPECLEEDIERHGLSAFKLKLSGKPDADAKRLLDIAHLLVAHVDRSMLRVSMDANEQYADLGALADALESVNASAAGNMLLSRLCFIEQPVPRRLVQSVAADPALSRVERFAPLLLDEGDTHTRAFHEAIPAGWRGVSVKPCKGVFRALLNHGLVQRSAGRLFLSAEDLTSPPLTSLQQDLSLTASLGLPDTEKNAHHYFRGLDGCSSTERELALRKLPRLFNRTGDCVHLDVHKGLLDLADCDGTGFGGPHVPWDELDHECFLECAS